MNDIAETDTGSLSDQQFLELALESSTVTNH